jgi:hypothetical protein
MQNDIHRICRKCQLHARKWHVNIIQGLPSISGSQDSSVSTETGYGLDDRGFGIQVSVGPRIFTSPTSSKFSPPSHRRRWKWDPVPGAWLGHPVPWGYKYGNVAFHVERVSNLRVKYDHEPLWTRTWEWLCWRGPAAIVKDRPILSSNRMLRKDYNSECSVEKSYWSWVSRGLSPRRTDRQ